MKTKYLLTALALPALFAACSQEEIVSDAQKVQSTELLGKIAGDVAFTFDTDSRLAWGATGNQTWETSDEFSLFWTGTSVSADSDLAGKANALYKKDGSSFVSENILYEGKHIMVYPVNKTHLTEKSINVAIAAKQDGNVALGNRSVYTNDTLLTICAPLTDPEDEPVAGVIYAAGYKKTVKATVKPLTSNLVLNLNFEMSDKVSEVTVKEVSLIAKDKVFATSGNLKADVNGAVSFSAIDSGNTDKMSVAMPTGTKVTSSNKACTAQIALFPVQEAAAATEDGGGMETETTPAYAIKVSTNYGIVTITDGKLVKNGVGQYIIEENVDQTEDDFDIDKVTNTALDMDEELALTKKKTKSITYRNKEYAGDAYDSYGKRITLNVTVKMSEASITGMVVGDSEELITAYETYDLLEKTADEYFELNTNVENNNCFELTPAAVAKILANNKVELRMADGINSIKLVGAHTSVPSFVVEGEDEDVALIKGMDRTVLILGANEWTVDVDKAGALNAWSKVINEGTLTITDSGLASNDKELVALEKTITNKATASFSGEVAMPVAYSQVAGTTTVPEGAYVTVVEKSEIDSGTVDVKGALTVNGNEFKVAKDAVVNVYKRFRNTSEGVITNLGTVKVADESAVVIITNNGNGDVYGVIELMGRDNSVSVSNENYQGYIKWACDVTTLEQTTSDVFNYVILSGNTTLQNAEYDYLEIKGDVKTTAGEDGECSLKHLFVNKNANMTIPAGTKINVTKKLVKNGDIDVIGDLIYNDATVSGNGYIFWNNSN